MISCTTKRLVAFLSFYTLLYDFFPREFVRGVQKSAPVKTGRFLTKLHPEISSIQPFGYYLIYDIREFGIRLLGNYFSAIGFPYKQRNSHTKWVPFDKVNIGSVFNPTLSTGCPS